MTATVKYKFKFHCEFYIFVPKMQDAGKKTAPIMKSFITWKYFRVMKSI